MSTPSPAPDDKDETPTSVGTTILARMGWIALAALAILAVIVVAIALLR